MEVFTYARGWAKYLPIHLTIFFMRINRMKASTALSKSIIKDLI